ncbi:MAG: 3-deoxy-7-phosphoheptulonate synthase [Flammeovirgaceae bacterium]|nr:3-deoxy-7-phosphoheptulonate synthase [Flammeovirgaceae bacterium]HCX21735.1 3-deoxy-7-phosphoheptulonate synthase [Cytophagales bacterium]
MIIHFKKDTSSTQIEELRSETQGIVFQQGNEHILVSSSNMKQIPQHFETIVSNYYVMNSDIQLADKSYLSKRHIQLGDLTIGNEINTHLIGGPCSVESWEQIDQTASFLKSLGIKTLRAGCYKPRTSPYTFQGLGEAGLKLLVKTREKHGLNIITEVKDSSHVDLVIEHTDIVQIGTKAMYDTSILRRCGQSDKPVLLKRGFGSTLQEFVQAAEFILSQGNPNVILCERGIRTFESKSRFTLDLTGVAYIKHHVNLPIFVDPSHAMGYRYGVPDLTRAAVAMGIDGLLIETHPTPEKALSDASQQLNFEEFEQMYHSLQPVAKAVGRTII